MKRIFTVAIFTTLFWFQVGAQISTNELPVSFSLFQQDIQTSSRLNKEILPSQNMNDMYLEDEENEQNGIPPRFGYRIRVDFNMENSGTWIDLPTGDRIWQLSIESPRALSLNLLYDKFWLPEGAKFFVFTGDKKQNIGAFTSRNNKGPREAPQGFATGLLYAENITLEYFQPKEIKEQGIISIAYVVHGYRHIRLPGMTTMGLGDSGSCQVNVNCSEGTNWQSEKNAVALILVNGNRYCTGSLVNTTGNDGIPYLLTADHCLGGWANSVKHDAISSPNLSHWSFYWQYESPTCANPSAEPPILSTVGATVVANNNNTDFALLLLTEDPKDKFSVIPYYLGWDRTGSAGIGGAGIHHPSGDIKKISTYSATPISTDFSSNTSNPSGNYWRAIWTATTTNHSVTEGGSSGSPLINNNKRIIGQLRGGFASCSNKNAPDWYGKFSVSWTGGGASDNRRRLDHWLHTVGGTAPTIANGRQAMYLTGPSFVCTSGTQFTLHNAPVGATVTWTAVPANLYQTSSGTLPSGVNTLTLHANSNSSGQGTITFSINTSGNSIQLKKIVNVNMILGEIIGETEFCADGTWHTWSHQGSSSIAEYTWYAPWYPYYVNSTTSNSASFYIDNNDNVDLQTIELYVSSAECPAVTRSYYYVVNYNGPPSYCSNFLYTVSPNPASDFIDVAQTKPTSKSVVTRETEYMSLRNENSITELRLYDNLQNLVKSVQYKGDAPEVRLHINDLQSGSYILHIVSKQGIEARHIVISPH